MKKRLILVSVLFVVVALFASCKKNCNCTVKSDGAVIDGYENITVGEMSKSDCAAYQDDTWEGLGYTYECVSE